MFEFLIILDFNNKAGDKKFTFVRKSTTFIHKKKDYLVFFVVFTKCIYLLLRLRGFERSIEFISDLPMKNIITNYHKLFDLEMLYYYLRNISEKCWGTQF